MDNKKFLICIYGNNAYAAIYNFCARLIKMCAFNENISYDICIAINKLDNGYGSISSLDTLIPFIYKNKPQIFITGFEKNYNICDFFIHSFLENNKFNLSDYEYVWCINGASQFITIDEDKANVLQDIINSSIENEFDGFNIDDYFNNKLSNYSNDYVVFQNILSKYILKSQSFDKIMRDLIQVFKNMKKETDMLDLSTYNFVDVVLPNIIHTLKQLNLKKLIRQSDIANTNMLLDICVNNNDILNTLLRLAIATSDETPEEQQASYDRIYNASFFNIMNGELKLFSSYIYLFIHGKIGIYNTLRNSANKDINTIKTEDTFVTMYINPRNAWMSIILALDTDNFYFIMPHDNSKETPDIELLYA